MRGSRSKRRSASPAGLEADRVLLERRLRELGLRGVKQVEVHTNRTVLVSVTAESHLRIHRGYAYAGDGVLCAVVTFVMPSVTVERRRVAQRAVEAFPVDNFVPPSRRRAVEPKRPGDRRIMARLRQLHLRLNRELFGGQLNAVRLRLSGRMRTRLGEVSVHQEPTRCGEVAISRHHVEQDSWEEVEHTLLHEMVHQWQVENGLPLDHGRTFRRKAVEVGIAPRAQRAVKRRRCSAG